jgi:hypothetical protein
MKKILLFILVFFIFFFLSILIFDYPKKFISRLIFSHDLSLLTHSVFYNINNEIEFDMTKKENKKKSLLVLNNYVYDFFKEVPAWYGPDEKIFVAENKDDAKQQAKKYYGKDVVLKRVSKNLDDGVSWKMLHGSIKCDGVTDIFLRLAENTNTRVAMIYLFNNDNISPHTLSFVDLDNSIKDYSDSDLKKMYLFDPYFNFFPINKKFQFVNINYMLENKNEFSSYAKLDSDNIKLNLLQNNKTVFLRNRIYDEYSFISKLSLKFVKVLPTNFLKFIFKFGIFINPELDDDYKKLLYARLEHILLNYDNAKVNYSKITNKNSYYVIAQYWYKRINSSQSVLKKYEDILSPLTNSTSPKNL